MKVVELQQGSNEWLEWRKTKITASEMGAILNVSPYLTALQLYEQKIGDSLGQVPSFAMQRGLELEPIARQMVSKAFELNLKNIVVEHDEHTYIAASLDGYDFEKKICWECKAPNRQEHAETELSGPPKKYYYQCQTQLMITGAVSLLYTTINGDHDLKHYWVAPDPTAFKEIKRAALEFYNNLQAGIPPELSERDYALRDDDEWKQAANDYLGVQSLFEETQEALKRARLELIRISNEKRTRGFGVRINFQKRRNSINYERLCLEHKIDAEKYRIEGFKTVPTVTVEQG